MLGKPLEDRAIPRLRHLITIEVTTAHRRVSPRRCQDGSDGGDDSAGCLPGGFTMVRVARGATSAEAARERGSWTKPGG